MKKVIAALIGLAAITLPQDAIALPVANRDELNNIIISGTGLAPGTFVNINYEQIFDSKNFTTGACNILTIKETSSFAFDDWIKVGGVQLNLSENPPPALAGSPCVKGVPNATYAWITAGIYRYIQSANNIYVIAPGLGAILVSGDIPKQRLGKVDSCGRISIKNSAKWPMAALNFGNGTFYYLPAESYPVNVALPTSVTPAMPICRKGTLYRRLEQ
jgi:hypothetical protein